MSKRGTKKKIVPANKPVAKRPIIDILILHGMDLEIVDSLIELGTCLGLNATTVLKSPSYTFTQDDRVKQAILKSKLILVLVTVDEEESESQKARLNVYDELRLAFTLAPQNLIVLQEKTKQNKNVNLPSNLAGKCVIIQFSRDQLHKLYTLLLSEIRSRRSLDNELDLEKKLRSGGVLNKFLDKMDRIWDDEFDDASDELPRSYESENQFQNLLDKFFLEYWTVFDALIRKRVNDNELKEICITSLNNANEFALRAWISVVEGKTKYAEYLLEKNKKSLTSELRKKLNHAVYIGKKRLKNTSIKEKILELREAVKELNECLELI